MASPRRARSLSAVVAAGDRRRSLEAIRDRLAVALESVDERYAAALAKQLSATLLELQGLAPAEEKSTVDHLAERRAARRAAKVPEGAAVDGIGGPGGS